MNERIQELAEQASDAVAGNAFSMARYNEKFAELIVRQCICLCDDENSQKYIAQKFGLAKELGLE